MLTFVQPAPSNKLIDFAQLCWPLYAGWLLGVDVSIQRADIKALKALCKQRVILSGNHSSHPDPSVMFGLSRAIHRNFAYMTARELFLDYPNRVGRLMQRFGCFSVTRAAPDLESYKATVKLLLEGKTPVVIFPEGEISHQNEFLLPLEGGPEQIALDVVSKLEKNGHSSDVFIQPLALLYRYRADLTKRIYQLLERLEAHLGLAHDAHVSIPIRIKRAYEVHLQDIARLEQIPLSDKWNFDELINNVRESVIRKIAADEEFPIDGYQTQVDKIHALRNVFAIRRFSNHLPAELLPLEVRNQYRMLKRVTNFIAIGEHSFKPKLTQEQVIELLTVLEYDLFRTISIRLRHLVHVGLSKPISVRQYLPQWKKNKHQAIENLKTELKRCIESELARQETLHPSPAVFS